MRKKELFLILMLFAFPWPAHADIDIGQPAPALVVKQLDGQTFDLSAQRGVVVIVSFWATWCGPCQQEMPALDAAYKKYHVKGLEVIGISADRPQHRDEVVATMKKFGYPAAMLADVTANGFGRPDVLPVTYVISRGGDVMAKLIPAETPLTEDNLDQILQPLLFR